MPLSAVLEEISPHTARDGQIKNRKGVLAISGRFSKDAGIEPASVSVDLASCILLESGHQPNLLPYAGVWRKVFLLTEFAKAAKGQEIQALPVFGFADYNIATANLLVQNRMPDTTRNGFRKIGWPIRTEDKWKRFDALEKPDDESFETHIQEIRQTYTTNAKRARMPPADVQSNLESITTILEDCYGRAKNYADFNAFTFARICADLLGLNVPFFRYSDVQKEGVFVEETRRLVTRTGEFNDACNASLEKRGLEDLGSVEDHFFPLWQHCSCGGKVTLSMQEDIKPNGRCPVCDAMHWLDFGAEGEKLDDAYADLAPTAMARNLIFAEGLGTDLFVSGAGGGLRYGAIANDAADALDFKKPQTLAWTGADHYLGVAHLAALTGLARALDASLQELSSTAVQDLVEARKETLRQELATLPKDDKKARQKIEGARTNIDTQQAIAVKVFEVVPSAADLYANVGGTATVDAWKDALVTSTPSMDEFIVIKADLAYPHDGDVTYTAMKNALGLGDVP